jgi:hypothetical protein
MSEGSVNGNTATISGGGVFVTAYGKFTMEGGTVSGNNAPKGGGVFVPYVSSSYLNTYPPITMSKDAAIHIDNPVYLEDGGVIILSVTLTANPVANIEYPTDSGTQVLADDTNTLDDDIIDNYTKFLLNDASDMIDEYGKIK